MFGNTTEFKRAVKLVAATLSFNKQSVVQIFEANIRFVAIYCDSFIMKDIGRTLICSSVNYRPA